MKESAHNHLTGAVLHPGKYPTKTEYPFSLPVFNETHEVSLDQPVTFLFGENGTGKSTFLEALARACHIEIWRMAEGERYTVNPYERLLYRCLSVNWANGPVPGSYFGSEIFNDFRQIVDSWIASDPGQLKYFGGESLLTQSHGQSIMSYFRSRCKLRGLYFLDEPETALSPKSQLQLLDILREHGRAGHAQFIIATHSPILLSFQPATIFSFDHCPISEIAYRDTEHFKIYRRLLLEEHNDLLPIS